MPAEQVDRVLVLLRNASSRAVEEDSPAPILADIADAQAGLNDLQGALGTLDAIHPADRREYAPLLKRLVSLQVESGAHPTSV